MAPTVKYATATSIDSWDVRKYTNAAYARLAFEGLLATTPGEAELIPALATEWEQDGEDSLTFTLRDGVTFHDGTAFDSEAVKANIEHLQSDAAGSWAGRFDSVVSVDTPSATEVVLNLEDPPVGFVTQFAMLGTEMISPTALADGSYVLTESGSGPFVSVPAESQQGSLEVFDKFADHWDAANVGPDRVEMYFIGDPEARLNAVTSGQVNVASITPEQISRAEDSGLSTELASSARNQVLFDDLTGPFGDVKVRQAICLALDRESMMAVQFDGNGTIAEQMVNEGSPGYDPSIKGYPYNLEKAQKLMDEAGNPAISFTLPVYGDRGALSEVVRDNLAAIGIQVTLEQMTSPQFFSIRYKGGYPIFYVSEGTAATVLVGPYVHYASRFVQGSQANPFNNSIPEMDEIVERGSDLADGSEEQNKVWQELNRYFNDEALECGFYDSVSTLAYNPAELGNVLWTQYSPHELQYRAITAGK